MLSFLEINNQIQKLRNCEREIKKLQEHVDMIKNDLKAEMDLRGVEVLDTGIHDITYKEVVSNRFDTTAFKKDHKDLYESYCKSSSTKRFTIK